MRQFAFATILLAVATMAQAAVQYRLTFTKDATNWYLYTEAVSQTDNVGLARFQVDVVGLPGTTITSSKLMAPYYLDMTSMRFMGFELFRSDGTNGIGIAADQMAGVAEEGPPRANLETIWHIGQLPGSGGTPPHDVAWGVSCLLASGTYTGPGEFAYVNAYGSAIVAIPDDLYDRADLTPVQFIPEPTTLWLLALTTARLMARRRRPSEVRAAE